MNERDPGLDALWRKHSIETPPAALDDAIRAAAHRAIHAKPVAATARARAPWPAWTTFAAAASIGVIAIGAWQLYPRDIDETRVATSDTPMRAQASSSRTTSDTRPSAPIATAPSAAPPRPATAQATAPADATGAAQSTPMTSAPSTQTSATPSPAPATVAAAAADAAAPAAAAAKTTPGTDTGGGFAPKAMAETRQSATDAKAAVGRPEPAAAAASRTAAMAAAAGRAAPANAVPAPTAPAASGAFADKALQKSQAPAIVAAKPSPFPRADAAAAPAAIGATPYTVGEFIDAIRRALDTHRDADAVTTLNAMRAQHANADAQLPADLREWAAQVPHLSR